MTFIRLFVGAFARLCTGQDITDHSAELLVPPPGSQLKMSFDGCGISYGCSGTLFAAGLRDETAHVALNVRTFIAAGSDPVVLHPAHLCFWLVGIGSD